MTALVCYHCGLAATEDSPFRATIFNQPRLMCCAGCQAVAEAIVENGLEAYYQHRTEMPRTADSLVPDELASLSLYDHPEVQKSFVDSNADIREASLILEGITCAACIWLNERHLHQLAGIQHVHFNYSSQRARIRWDNRQLQLSTILGEIRKLGYQAHPFSAQQQDAMRQKQRKQDIRRIAVAGLSAGQVMMMAVALYAGASQGLEFATGQLLRWFSLMMSVPAITYAAWPFYQSAWQGLKAKRMSMDVPISLGLLTGFVGSLWATLSGEGVVYFDTITMLIFFLLGTRYIERNAREKSIEAAENLLRLTPAVATKLLDGQPQLVAVAELTIDDQLLIKPGETIAADGLVVEGESHVDESLLSGESRPIKKSPGDHVLAGSINTDSPITIQITATAEDTILASIARLLDRAQSEKPKLTQATDRIAAYFTTALLLIVAIVGLYWAWADPHRIVEIVLTVLVVSCPCALSLAAPAAFAAASSRLVQHGMLLTRGHAIETLAKVNHLVFDKTGTLTVGKPRVIAVKPLSHVSSEECLAIAASLETQSEHPIAQAFLNEVPPGLRYAVSEVSNTPGQGITGMMQGAYYRLGNAALHTHVTIPTMDVEGNALAQSTTVIWLSNQANVIAAFVIADPIRAEANQVIQALKADNLTLHILSGDAEPAVTYVAQQLGITNYRASCSPQEKLDYLQQLQQQGHVVAMVGDGINDAPVLAGAQVSVAMGHGTQMARASGDMILLHDQLIPISISLETSRLCMQIIRQNFAWAVGYNLFALPFAASGLISPWMAAIGMSVSSLIVVLNALRLR